MQHDKIKKLLKGEIPSWIIKCLPLRQDYDLRISRHREIFENKLKIHDWKIESVRFLLPNTKTPFVFDYRLDRLNVLVGEKGTIEKIDWG